MGDQQDLIICILPKISPQSPTAGPGILKAHLTAAGFSSTVHDLNIELYQAFKHRGEHERYWYQDDAIFVGDNIEVTDEFAALMEQYMPVIRSWIEHWKALNPKRIGLSLLSHFSQQPAIYLSQLIKRELPGTEVIWGGAYIEHWILPNVRRGNVDHFIYGDAEDKLVQLLRGETGPGIDNFNHKQFDLNKVMLPDYDDISWESYENLFDEKSVFITGSRGCVKRCTFCNVADIWPEFRYRSGKDIADEMIWLRQRYQRDTFLFTDSLINGSMRAFRDMLQILKDYRDNQDSDWQWTSQYIIRSVAQSPETDFKLMLDSGCKHLDIGIESFSQTVRWHMGKKFTDNDMWHTLELLAKYGINASLLTFVGYPTETEADHQANLRAIERLAELGYLHGRDGFAMRPTFGNLCFFDNSMPLWDQLKADITDWKGPLDWTYKENTFLVRMRRYEEIHALMEKHIPEQNIYTKRNIANYRKKAAGEIPEGEWAG